LGACRYLRHLDLALHWAFLRAITAKPYLELWTQRRDLDVSFRASAALRPVLVFFWTTVLDSWVWFVALLAIPVVLSATLVIGRSNWTSIRDGVVLWLVYAFLFAYASGVRPRWITFLVPRESFGLVVLFRIYGVISIGFSVAFIWLDSYFPDLFAELIKRDRPRDPGAIWQTLVWTMFPFVCSSLFSTKIVQRSMYWFAAGVSECLLWQGRWQD
jgi:hypothetical protein